MSKAEERAFEAYPAERGHLHDRPFLRDGFIHGYEQAEKDIISIIGIRLSEIIGDAQPRPALRAELEELIKQIKDGKD